MHTDKISEIRFVRFPDKIEEVAFIEGDPPQGHPHVSDYSHAHYLVRRERGVARLHVCVDCGEQATDWSYDGLDPNELVESSGPTAGLRYSLDQGHYQPRCKVCHVRLDHPR